MNNITRDEPLNYIPFKDISQGSFFFIGKNTYIKTHGKEPSDSNACNLKTGEDVWIETNTMGTTVGTVVMVTDLETIEQS